MMTATDLRSSLTVVASASASIRTTFRQLSLVSAVALALTAGGLALPVQAQPGNWAEGRALVQFQAGLPQAEQDKILKAHGGKTLAKIEQVGVHIIEVPVNAEDAVVQALSHNPHVKFAEKDMLVEASLIPNDPNYSSAWHLPKIAAPTAWDASSGSGVVVAILDTGVYAAHPEFSGRLVAGYNSADGTNNTADINGHGTMVAGTAAAATNNGLGVAGVAGNAQIMPVRVTNDSTGYAYWSSIASGLSWAADHGARVANISYDATGSSSIASAAQYLRGKGGLTVVAAGNDGANPGYADSPYIISVSATNSSDSRTSWSNYGAYVDVAAPGDGIWTTLNGGGYGTVWGTSFSSPTTAGVVALMMAANPGLSPADLESALKSSADDLGAAGRDDYYGYGRINAGRAVQAAMTARTTDTQAPTVAMTAPVSSAKVKGLVTVGITASDNVGVDRVDLYVNGAKLASDSTAPFGFSWDTTPLADGNVTLVAYAFDAAGNQGLSSAVSVTVDNVPDPVDATPPTVNISNPVNGAKVSGVNVTINVNASDNVAVTKTTCAVDGQVLSISSNASLKCTWNIKQVAAGAHSISATAEDAAGNKTSTAIQVTK